MDDVYRLRNECLSRDPLIQLSRLEDVSIESLYATDDSSDYESGRRYVLRERKKAHIVSNTFDSDTSEAESDDSDLGDAKSDNLQSSEEEPEQITKKVKHVKQHGKTKGSTSKSKPKSGSGPKTEQRYYPRLVTSEMTCQDCGEFFKSVYAFSQHAKEVHGNDKPFVCHTCKLPFGRKPELVRHKMDDHNMVTPVRPKALEKNRRNAKVSFTPADILCYYCGKKFESVLDLKRHTLLHYSRTANHQCEMCDLNCKSAETLRHHFYLVHLGFKHLGSAKKMSQMLKEHAVLPEEARKAPQYVSCDVCCKIFWWEWKLNEHKLKIHGIGKDERHRKPGKPGKPYYCPDCDIYFKARNMLHQHMNSKKHTTDKRFICETCGKTFRKSDGMRKHIAKRHPEVVLPRRYEYGLDILETTHAQYAIKDVFAGFNFDETPDEEEMVSLAVVAPAEGRSGGQLQTQPLTDPLAVVSEAPVAPPAVIAPVPAAPPAVIAPDTTTSSRTLIETPVPPAYPPTVSGPICQQQITSPVQLHSPEELFGGDEIESFGDDFAMEDHDVDTKPILPDLGDDNVDDYDEQVKPSALTPKAGKEDLNSDQGSESNHGFDKSRLERLRRACRRRELREKYAEDEDNYHEVSVTVKIEQGFFDENKDEEWIPPEDAEVEDLVKTKKKSRRTKFNKKRKPTTDIVCRLGGCRYRARDRPQLIRHRSEIHGKEEMRSYDFKCTKCSFKATSAESLEFHQVTHESPTKTPVAKRHRRSQLNSSLEKSLDKSESTGTGSSKRKRKPDRKIKCRLAGCRFRANDKEELAAHRLKAHGRSDGVRSYEFKCEEPNCTFRARYQESYDSHKLTHQNRDVTPVVSDGKQPAVTSAQETPVSAVKVDKRPYPCTYPGCPKAFSHRIRLVQHIQNIHTSNFPGTSQATPRTPTTRTTATPMSDIYTNARQCRMNGCTFLLKSRTEREAHRREVHGRVCIPRIRKRRYRTGFTRDKNWLYCGIQGCNFRALLPETIAGHKRTAHDQLPRIKEYPCPHCDKVFSSNAYRHTHVLLKHTGAPKSLPRIPCMHCTRTFSCRWALFGHIQRAHPDAPTFPCTICTKIFFYEDEKTLHEDRHTRLGLNPETKYKCAVQACTEVCETVDLLQAHVKAVHDVPIDATTICPICGKETLAYGYAAHTRTHLEKVRKHKCDYCDQAYVKPILLERHQEISHPELFEGQEKSFICDACGMSFYQQGTFNIHRYTMHGKAKQKRLENSGQLKRRRGRGKATKNKDGETKQRRKRRTKEEMIRAREAAAHERKIQEEKVTQLGIAAAVASFSYEEKPETESLNTNSVGSADSEMFTPPPLPPPAHRSNPGHSHGHFPHPQYHNNPQGDPHAQFRSYFLQNPQLNYPTYDPHYLYHH